MLDFDNYSALDALEPKINSSVFAPIVSLSLLPNFGCLLVAFSRVIREKIACSGIYP